MNSSELLLHADLERQRLADRPQHVVAAQQAEVAGGRRQQCTPLLPARRDRGAAGVHRSDFSVPVRCGFSPCASRSANAEPFSIGQRCNISQDGM